MKQGHSALWPFASHLATGLDSAKPRTTKDASARGPSAARFKNEILTPNPKNYEA